jgi:hypothetical protein
LPLFHARLEHLIRHSGVLLTWTRYPMSI